MEGTRTWSTTGLAEGDVKAALTIQGMANVNTTEHDGAEFVFTYLVDGAVAGCGDGEFLLYSALEYFETDGDIQANDPEGSWTGTWQVVPYSGRSELVGLSGSGTVSGRLGDPGFTMTGSFQCDGSPVNPPAGG